MPTESDISEELRMLFSIPAARKVLLGLKKCGSAHPSQLAVQTGLPEKHVEVVLEAALRAGVADARNERLDTYSRTMRRVYTCSVREDVLRALFAGAPALASPPRSGGYVSLDRLRLMRREIESYDYVLPENMDVDVQPTKMDWLGREVPLEVTPTTKQWAGVLCLAALLEYLDQLIAEATATEALPDSSETVEQSLYKEGILERVRGILFSAPEKELGLNLEGVLADLQNPTYKLDDGGVCVSTLKRVIRAVTQVENLVGRGGKTL